MVGLLHPPNRNPLVSHNEAWPDAEDEDSSWDDSTFLTGRSSSSRPTTKMLDPYTSVQAISASIELIKFLINLVHAVLHGKEERASIRAELQIFTHFYALSKA
jgi:hypothetical protein